MLKLLVVLGLAMTLTACNTVAGFGEDITSSADWVKKKIGGGDHVDLNNPPANASNANTVTVTPVSGSQVTAKPVQ